jgi:hypothetical protein
MQQVCCDGGGYNKKVTEEDKKVLGVPRLERDKYDRNDAELLQA